MERAGGGWLVHYARINNRWKGPVVGFVYSSLMRVISNHEENVTPSNKYLMCVKCYFSIVFSKHDFSNRKVITMFCWCDCPGSFFNVLVTLVLSQYDTIFSVKFFTKYKFLATDVIKHKSHVHGSDFLVSKLNFESLNRCVCSFPIWCPYLDDKRIQTFVVKIFLSSNLLEPCFQFFLFVQQTGPEDQNHGPPKFYRVILVDMGFKKSIHGELHND